MYGDRAFIRTALSLAMTKGATTDARAFASAMIAGPWNDTPDVIDAIGRTGEHEVQRLVKSVVDVTDLDSTPAAAASTPFVEGVRRESIPGRLLELGARRLPFRENAGNARIVGVGAAWRTAGDPIVVVESAFENVSLPALGVGGMIVATSEFIELATRDASAADTIDALLRGAAVTAVDDVFASTDAAVADTSPAGVLRNVQTVAASGATVAAIANDVNDAVQALTAAGVSLRSVVAIMSPEAAPYLRLLKLADASGETLAGMPIVDTAPSGTFALIATEFLAIAMADVAAIQASGEGTVQLRTDPDGTATNVVSLWQKNLRALRTTLFMNWELVGPEDSSGNKLAAVSITGATYA
jgi:hypothetical protein